MNVKEREASEAMTWPRRAHQRWEDPSPETKGRISKILMELTGLKSRTLNQYGEFLVRLAELGPLDDVENTQKMRVAYRRYCRVHRLPESKIYVRTVDGRRSLPRLLLERTLQASVAIPRSPKWRAYLMLLYETGPRPTEGLELRVRILDLEKERIRLGTEKRSRETIERELPISSLLASMLKDYTREREPEDPVFPRLHTAHRPCRYGDAERLMERVRVRCSRAETSPLPPRLRTPPLPGHQRPRARSKEPRAERPQDHHDLHPHSTSLGEAL